MHLKYSLGTKEQMVSRPNAHFCKYIIINSVSNIAKNIKLLLNIAITGVVSLQS